VFEVGETPTFFIDAVICAVALSLSTVGQGVVELHGAGEVTFLITSDSRTAGDKFVTVTRTGERLSLTTSPQETHPMSTAAASAAVRMYLVMAMS